MAKKSKKNKKQQQNQQRIDIRQADVVVVNMSSKPLLLRAFMAIGCVLKILGIYILIMFTIVMVMVGLDILFENGIKAFVAYWIDFFTFWNMENLLFLFIVTGPFVFWCISAGWLKKHYKERIFKACADKIFIETKGGKTISLTYEELNLSIRTRKIKIGPDWIEIPYDTGMRYMSPEWIEGPIQEGKIRIYSFGKKDIGKLLALISEKCGMSYETKIKEIMEAYKVGLIMTYFVGWPVLLGSIYIGGLLYFIEGYESVWELVKAIPENHVGVVSGGIIGVFCIISGYIVKILISVILRDYCERYKDYFHISR